MIQPEMSRWFEIPLYYRFLSGFSVMQVNPASPLRYPGFLLSWEVLPGEGRFGLTAGTIS